MKAKNLFLFLFSTILSLVCFTPDVHAQEIPHIYAGTGAYNNIYYYFYKDGTAELIQKPQTSSYNFDFYSGVEEVEIPEKVVWSYNGKSYTVIAVNLKAFLRAEDIKKVTLPNTVTSIGNGAFVMSDIKEVNIPNSVTYIGRNLFAESAYAKNLLNWDGDVLYKDNCLISIKDDIKQLNVKSGTRLIASEIGEKHLKEGHYNVEQLYLPNSVEYICNKAFYDNDKLTTVVMSNQVKRIEDEAFYKCPIETNINFPASLEYLGSYAFGDANFTEITFPETTKCDIINECAFIRCKNLKKVVLSKNISRIEESAFRGCVSLRSIDCPGKTLCAEDAFEGVETKKVGVQIKERYVQFYMENWKGFDLNPVRFKENGIYYTLNDEKRTASVNYEAYESEDNYSKLTGTITIPKTLTDEGDIFNVTELNDRAFKYAPIEKITIEAPMTAISSEAFFGAKKLTSATLPKTTTKIERQAFEGCTALNFIPGLTNEYPEYLPYLDSIQHRAFAGCTSLTKVRLRSSKYVGTQAFLNCTGITDVVLGPSVAGIGAQAFAGCTKLEKLTNLAAKPQPFPDKLFDGIDKAQFVIYVHRTAYEAFKAADGWKDYNIQIIPSEVQYFTIRLTVNDEKAGTVSGGGSYVEGTEVTVTATPKEGYHFVRWSDGETKASYSFKLTKDLSLQAIFEEDVIIYYYDLKLQSNDEKLGTVSGGGTHIEKGTKVTITATPAEGCEFLYWVDANGAYWGKQTEWTVTKDETLTAHFRVIPDYDEYLVFVLGEQVTSANASDILDDGVWSYDRATHTLYTMKDATYKKENAGFIQDWETDLGAMTVVVNHQITAEVETTDNVGRWAIYGHKGMKFVGSKFKFIDVRALNMMAAHTLQPLEVSNHLRLFITEGNTTEYGKNYYSTPMIFSGTPAIKVNSASVRLSVGLGDKISNQTNEQIELTNAEINYGELNGQYLEILDQTPMYMVNYETEEAMFKCYVSGMGSFYEGEQVTLRAQPETSYKFVRWSDGSTDNPYTFTMPAHDVLIDPVVEAEEIAPTGAFINADAPEGEGTIKDDFTGGWFEEGVVVTITVLPEEEYNFVKWSDGNTDNPRIITVEAGKDITIHAEFAQKERFTVTFLDWDDEVLKEENVYKGEDAEAPDQPYRKGYTFTGWDKDYTNVTADMTVKAQFDINVYTVRFFDREDVQIGEDQHIEYGKAAVAPDAPKVEGYVFVDWSKFFDFVESDLDIYAVYDLQRFKAEFIAGEHGTLETDLADLDAIPYGESILLIATPEEHYEIDKWSDGGKGDTRSIVVTSDTTVSVTFVKKKYMVTFIGFGGATIKYEYVTAGEGATAPDLPAVHGYHFVEWDKPFNEIWENTTVTAIYEADPVNIPENLKVVLTEIEGDTQLDFSWDVLEGAVSYTVGFGYGDEQHAMIPAPTNSLTLLLSKFVKDNSIKPGTYTVRWFVAGMDSYAQPMGDWAEGESFQITVKDTGTGLESIQNSAVSIQKVLINGTLYILIGDRTFDATGRLVN